jgi:hypothetical protein
LKCLASAGSALRFAELSGRADDAQPIRSYAASVVEVATRTDARRGRSKHGAVDVALVCIALAVAVVVVNRWGELLVHSGHVMKVGVPPLHAVGNLRIGRSVLPVLGIGAVLLVGLPTFAARASWHVLLGASAAVSALWTVALNATDGVEGLVHGLDNRHEYLRDVGAIGSPFAFLREFTDHIGTYATHTRGHPPGFVLVAWLLDRAGFGGAGWAAALCIGVGALAVPAVLVVTRDVAGERTARAAMPFVAVAPVALWVGSSADAFYAGLGACAVALMVRAICDARRPAASAAGGVAFGALLMCSYGLALLGLVPLAYALQSRRLVALFPAAVGIVGVLTIAYALGFNYLAGLRATHAEYVRGVAGERPYVYALVANLVVFALVLGPAVVAGIAQLRDRHLWTVVGGALAAVATADLTGLSKLEVERIWLPFAVFALPAAAALVAGRRATMVRPWLGLQIALALGIQVTLRTGW